MSADRPGKRRRKVLWTSRAIRDLSEIHAFIATDDPGAADRWISALVARAKPLGQTPFAGRVAPELGRSDIREVLVKHYRIVYLVREDALEVLTVFEGHRLFPRDLELP